MGQVSRAWFLWCQGWESSPQQIPSFPERSLQENLVENAVLAENITKKMVK